MNPASWILVRCATLKTCLEALRDEVLSLSRMLDDGIHAEELVRRAY